MSGRFKKAPLVYVTARIRTTPIPPITSDQRTLIQQAMMKLGLVIPATSQGASVNIGKLSSISQTESGFDSRQIVKPVERQGYFTSDRSQCLIIDEGGIEWRASIYNKYDDFARSFGRAIDALVKAADVLGFLQTQELILSYADIIAPLNGRTLDDYFNNADAILPLSIVKNIKSDLQQTGQVQVTRIVKPDQKITIALEQIPVLERKVHKYLPANMIEPDNILSMPIHLHPEWSNLDALSYGSLMTQAGVLKSFPLGELNVVNDFKDLHKLTKDTFKSLLNSEVCNADWEYEETKGVH